MKKYIIILISFFLIVGCSKEVVPKVSKESLVTDGITFKTEYENQNEEMNDNLTIDKENPFKYLKKSNIDKVFQGNNIIFIGNSYDINSRIVVKILLSLAEDFNVKDIYYLDSLKNFAKYEISVNGQVKIQDESVLYNTLLEQVKSLGVDVSDGLSSPSIIFIKDGKISNYVTDFVDLYDEGFSDVKYDNVKTDLYKIMENFDLDAK